MKQKEQKPADDIISEAYDEIMSKKNKKKKKGKKKVTDLDVEQYDELINPDPDSLDSRG